MLLALPVLVANMAAAARTCWAAWSFITVFTVKECGIVAVKEQQHS